MALIEWKDSFSTGNRSIDHEHRGMIGLINELYEALRSDPSPEAVAAFLGEIHARISAHFALEERIMRERKYDARAEHKADHEALLDEILDIMENQESAAPGAIDERLAGDLERWFGNHFRTHDARLHRMIDPE